MTKYYIEIFDDLGKWVQTAPMFLRRGDIVRYMKIRPWLCREFLGGKFLATMRWEYDRVMKRFVFVTMTDDGLQEMWP